MIESVLYSDHDIHHFVHIVSVGQNIWIMYFASSAVKRITTFILVYDQFREVRGAWALCLIGK